MIFTVCKFLTRVVFTLLYRHKVYGVKKNLVKGAAIIAANHSSYLDPIALQLSVRGCLHHLARSTLFSNRFTGWLHREWGSYPVKKGGGNSAAFKAAFELFKRKKAHYLSRRGAEPNGRATSWKSWCWFNSNQSSRSRYSCIYWRDL